MNNVIASTSLPDFVILREYIAALERENAEKARLLQECTTHLKGYKMSMLARTPERLRAAIEAALQAEEPNNVDA